MKRIVLMVLMVLCSVSTQQVRADDSDVIDQIIHLEELIDLNLIAPDYGKEMIEECVSMLDFDICDPWPCPGGTEICEQWENEYPDGRGEFLLLYNASIKEECPQGMMRDRLLYLYCIFDYREALCDALCKWREDMCNGDPNTFDADSEAAWLSFIACEENTCIVEP